MTTAKNTKVLVVGTYCGLNKGDRLMQQVTANTIREAGGTPLLSSPFPHIDKKIYRDIPIVKARRRNLPLSLFQCMMLWILPKNLRNKYAEANEELKHFSDAALIIDTSGDMLTEDYGPHVALSHLFPLLYCLLLKKRLLILAQSVGPFSLFRGLFRKVFQHAEQVNVRDEISYRYLEPYDITGLTQVADLGFLLEQKSFDTSSITGASHFSGRKLIGICPSALFFDKFATDKIKVSLDLFCQMLNRAAAKHNLAYVLVPHVLTPSGSFDDFNFSEEMVKRITEPCQIADSTLEPSELKYLVSKLSAMITFRMHGAIAAIDTYTPTIAISYSHKTDGLFEMLQLDDWVVANTSELILDVETKLSTLLDDSENIRNHLKSVIPVLRAKAGLNQVAIQKALN